MQIAFWDIGEDGNNSQNDTITIVHTSAQPGQLFDVTSIGYWLLYVLPRCICFWRCTAQPNLVSPCENQMSRINESYLPVLPTVTQPLQLPFFFFFSKAIYITYFEICKTINFIHIYKCQWSLPNLKVAKVSQKNKRKLYFLGSAMTERLELLLLLTKLQFALHRLDWLSSGHLRKIHGEGLSIQVIYEDQEKNDFNSLFNRLSGKALSV